MLTASASAQTLNLYAKYAQPHPSIDPWDINACTNAPSGVLTYNLTGPDAWEFIADNLKDTEPYVLIYYADPWPGTNGAVIGTGTSNGDGDLTIPGITPPIGNIPVAADLNNPLGGKIWLVTATDYNEDTNAMGPSWNPKNYLFEHEGGLNYVVNTSAADVEITAGEIGVDAAGTSIKLPIDMSAGANKVGSIQLEIDYNQVIISGGLISVNVNGVTSTLGDSLAWSNDPINKIVTISIIDSAGLSGDINLAEIDFNISAATSGDSILYGMSLEAEVTDNKGTPVKLLSAVDNGHIWIKSAVITEVVGDADEDGYVTSTDALLYLEDAAALSPAGVFVNICGTSYPDITAWDALMVLQASTSGLPLTEC